MGDDVIEIAVEHRTSCREIEVEFGVGGTGTFSRLREEAPPRLIAFTLVLILLSVATAARDL